MQQHICASSSSSSSMTPSLKKYDVFISFRGEDTRRNFTCHLYDALSKKVLTFIDDTELQRGDEISSVLIKAIEESVISVVIFSKDYASSKWCLNELVRILECKRDQRQIVIPVFYDIEPTHVRNQTGSFKEAFKKHEQNLRHNKDKLKKWKDALTEASNLSGWNSQDYRNDVIFIRVIVEDVLKKLNRRHPFQINKELVGVEEKCEKVESLLKLWSNDVRILVLWGMGGIGKTTLAKHLYAKQCSLFDRHCFIENIREESTRCGQNFAHNKLFSTLLELPLNAPYVETPTSMRTLKLERSLIVLDGVETLEQAENVNIVNNCLGKGSRVIITTRDRQICSQFEKCEIYEFEEMNESESLQLFCRNAFGQQYPKDGYDDLSKEAILYCSGNPLALKVLGANFRTKKDKKTWESELEKLKKIPNRRIYDVLKSSFDDLDSTQKDIFLDIAFQCKLGIVYEKYYLTALWNACKFFAESGFEVLVNKALIYFENDQYVKVDSLLVEMGLEIVRKESEKHPGRRSRLWDEMEVYDVLKNNKGTEVVEVIYFDSRDIEDWYLSSDSFKNMTNLRILRIKSSRLHFLEGLERLSDKLKHLQWNAFPLESLPSTFCAKWLVQLSMQHSKLKKLWNGIQRLYNLMILDLGYSKDLIEIPDLSRAPNLEVVNLSYCESLCQLHPSIFSSPKLRELNLYACTKLESLKSNIHSKSLQIIDLTKCSSLVEFTATSEEIMELRLCGTAVREFSSIKWCHSKLEILDLSECTQIDTLNLGFILYSTRSLVMLNMKGCCNLETLPDNVQNNSMLKTLDLRECSKLKSIPKLPASLSTLELDECRILKSLPNLPATLSILSATNCTYLDTNSIQKSMFESMLHKFHTNKTPWFFCFLPRGQVPTEFKFRETEASIAIRPTPGSILCGFAVCLILSKGLEINGGDIRCSIYEDSRLMSQTKLNYDPRLIRRHNLLSDHVFLCCTSYDDSGYVYISNNILLKFEYYCRYKKVWLTKGIKGCGVIPLYGESNSSVKIVELQPNAQVADDYDQRCSTDENEDDPQQLLILPTEDVEELDDKSSCECNRSFVAAHARRIKTSISLVSQQKIRQHQSFYQKYPMM